MGSEKVKLIFAAAFMAVLIPGTAQAQWWQRHPAYLHAMSDLRVAYWLIQHHDTMDPFTNGDERHALKEIRAAYQELKDASIVDDKNIDDQPPADTNFYDHRGRLHHALELLHDAHNQVDGEEDDLAARGLKKRALKHIDEAAHATDDAIHTWNF